jgi:hypothetical protein
LERQEQRLQLPEQWRSPESFQPEQQQELRLLG